MYLRLTENFVQTWHARLNKSSRTNFYITIADFRPKVYFNPVKVLTFRNALARLRVSSHRLEIEAGRWDRPYKPIYERLCNNCNRLEDEYYFVIECMLYNSLTRKYVDQVYWRRSSMYKFVKLIQSKNTRTITNLAICVYNAYKIRHNEMYAKNNL